MRPWYNEVVFKALSAINLTVYELRINQIKPQSNYGSWPVATGDLNSRDLNYAKLYAGYADEDLEKISFKYAWTKSASRTQFTQVSKLIMI